MHIYFHKEINQHLCSLALQVTYNYLGYVQKKNFRK